MGFFRKMKEKIENKELKKDIEYLEMKLEATERVLVDRKKDVTRLMGEKEEQRQLIEYMENMFNRIIETAHDNTYGNTDYKLKKIIELAKFEDHTSSINK